jgi:hypothetical protein
VHGFFCSRLSEPIETELVHVLRKAAALVAGGLRIM